MPTRTRRQWKADRNGSFSKQIGWKTSCNGKPVQAKFRLGSDVKVARQREACLQQLWAQIERTSSNGRALWTDATLAMAKQIAKGEPVSCPKLADETDEQYAIRIGRSTESRPKSVSVWRTRSRSPQRSTSICRSCHPKVGSRHGVVRPHPSTTGFLNPRSTARWGSAWRSWGPSPFGRPRGSG